MVAHLKLAEVPAARPLDEWPSIAVCLVGTETRFISGERFTHRVISIGEDGEPLVLIHGVGGHAEVWARNFHNLAFLGFHVHAIDALYHGLSDKEPWSDDPAVWPEIQVDALADVIRALDVGPVFVAGESMGALMAFELAMRFPDLCRRVVMNTGFGRVKVKRDFGPRPQGSPELRRLSQESVINPTFENLRARMDWLVVKPENMTDEMVRLREKLYSFPGVHQAMLRIYRPGQPWKWNIKWEEEDLQQFQPEALVFWTDHNPTNGPEYGEYVASLLPNSWFYLMENAGHWPQWERPEEHDAVLAQFLLGGPKA